MGGGEGEGAGGRQNKERERENSKTLYYKDCSLGSVKMSSKATDDFCLFVLFLTELIIIKLQKRER